jgi:hypothetical protein
VIAGVEVAIGTIAEAVAGIETTVVGAEAGIAEAGIGTAVGAEAGIAEAAPNAPRRRNALLARSARRPASRQWAVWRARSAKSVSSCSA